MESDRNRKFDIITGYIPLFDAAGSIGEWVFDKANDGTAEHPKQMPYFSFNRLTLDFIKDVYEMAQLFDEHLPFFYIEILKTYNIAWSEKNMREADVSDADAECVLALLIGILGAERFNEGLLSSFFEYGDIRRWLMRLKEIDDMAECDSWYEEDDDSEEDEELEEDDCEMEGRPGDSLYFMQLYKNLKNGLSMYIKLHNSENSEKFIKAVFAYLDNFSEGEEGSECFAFDFSLRVDEEIRYVSFNFEPGLIEVTDGGSVYEEGIGHDSYTNWMYSIWRDGSEDCDSIDFSIIEDIVLEGAVLGIEVPDEFAATCESGKDDEY